MGINKPLKKSGIKEKELKKKNMAAITEKDHLEEVWFKEASKQTLESLPAFLNHLAKDYEHDYGTICYAVAAAALGAVNAFDRSPQGGITGFQAGQVLWVIIRWWFGNNTNKCGFRLVDYDEMLYPQYEYKFEKVIKSEILDNLKNRAKELLEMSHDVHISSEVWDHWLSIADGKAPFGYTVEEE